MFPGEFIERIKLQTYIDVPDLLSALERPGPVSIRLNPVKWNNIPASSSPVPWCKTGFYLEVRPSFTADPLFHAGCYYPQEASSMFVSEVFEQVAGDKKNLRVLDLCGAPGGKSTHLSVLIGSRGLLVANEVIRQRADILAENLTKWGTGNSIVTRNDPSVLGRLRGYFDIILIDAPCSGEGMFRDSAALKEWSPLNAAMCSERQRRILMDVWPALKKDGILIYSTCTFNPAENEENVKWLAEKTGAESIKLNISAYKGIQEIYYKGITGYGFQPGKITGEGFFIAAIRKDDDASFPAQSAHHTHRKQLLKDERNISRKLISEPLPDIFRIGEDVYALPSSTEEFLYLKERLKIVKCGTGLFRYRGKDFSPLHDLALSHSLIEDAFPTVELDLPQAVLYLKKESIVLNDIPKGWVLVKYRDVSLGFIKNLGIRLNNYFPAGWRIRMKVPADMHQVLINWNEQAQ